MILAEQSALEFFDGATAGFFVEVGVSHPTLESQSWPLEQAGWTGALVEAQPDLAAFLVASRSAKVFAVACSAPDKAGGSLSLRVSHPQSGPGRAADASATHYTVLVPVRTLDSILEEAEAPIPIDFLSINAGGHVLQALSGFDFARWQPYLVALRRTGGGLKAHRHLRQAGYHLIRCGGETDWYTPGDLDVPVAWRQRWANVRQLYLGWPLRVLGHAMQRLRRR